MTNKKSKKFFAIAASSTLVASAIVPVVSANPTSFPDVGPDNFFKNDIETLAQQKIINGFPDGNFKPKVILKRRDVVTMLAKYMNVFQGEQYPSNFNNPIRFQDLAPLAGKDDDLLRFAALAYDKGIFEGYNGQLSYNNEITREEAGASVLRLIAYALGFDDEEQLMAFLEEQEDYASRIRDLDKASSWARDSIDALSYLNITLETNFNPLAKIPREQFAAFMNRAMNNTLNNPEFVAKVEAYFNENDTPTVGIITVSPDGGVLGISGAKPGDIYTIYNSSGVPIGIGTVKPDGTLQITLSQPVTPQDTIKVVIDSDGKTSTIETKPNPTTPTTPPAENTEEAKAQLSNLINGVKYVATSENGEDIATTAQWTTLAAKQAFEAEVQKATTVKDNASASLAELNQAITDLNSAISTYNAAKQSGKKPTSAEETKATLETLIRTIETLKSEQYTEESWAVLKALLDNAKILLANPNASLEDLTKAIDSLVAKDGTDTGVNETLKQTLTELIANIDNLKETDYTAVTWSVVQTEKGKAQTLVNNPDAKKEDLLAAVDSLTKAINGLVKADDQNNNGLSDALEKRLVDLLAEIAKLNQSSYTPLSWSNLDNKVKAADGSYANNAEIEAVIKGIEDAKNALVLLGNKEALNKLITDAGAMKVATSINGSDIAPINKWTSQASLDALNNAITNAQTVANNANADQAMLTSAVTTLNNAITAYRNAMQNGTAKLELKHFDFKANLIAETVSNTGVGGFTNVARTSDFTTLGLGLLDVVSLDAIANNTNVNNTKFTVPDNHRFSMDFTFTSSALLGLSRKNIAIYKQEGDQLKRVWQDGFGSLSLLGIPIQSKYNFSVSNLMPGEYIFAVVRNDGLAAEVISGNTIEITDRTLVKMTSDINSQQSIVTAGITGNVITNNSFSANNVKVSKVNNRTFTTETANQTVAGNYGTLTINPSTGSFTYKSTGTPLAISKVETFEYTLTDNEGRVGTNKIYIRFNEEGEPEYNWSTSDLSAEINFGTASSERTSTTLTYTSEGQYEYKSKSATIDLQNTSSRTVTTELIDIPDTQSILSFEVHTTGTHILQYEVLDAANRPITLGASTINSIKTNVSGSVIEVKGLAPGNYKIKLSNLESNVNSTYGVRNIVVRHNKYTGGAVTGNIKSNDSISNNLALVFAGTMVDGAKTIDGQYGSITINPDGTFTYNTNYTRRVNLGSLFDQNVDFYPITGYLGQTEVFNYYYEKPNGEQIPAKLEIYLDGAARELPFKTNTINLTANNTVATAANAPLAYTVSNKTDAASTIDFEE